MILELQPTEWFIEAGLIGFYRVFQYGLKNRYIPEKFNNDVLATISGLKIRIEDFEDNILNYIGKSFFEYYIEIFNRNVENSKRLEDFVDYFEDLIKESIDKKQINDISKRFEIIKKIITTDYKKVIKYKEQEGVSLPEEKEFIKPLAKIKIKSEEDIKEYIAEAIKIIKQYLDIISQEVMQRRLSLLRMRRSFPGQTSFLNTCNDNLSIEECIEVFNKDYISPIIDEISFIGFIENKPNKEEFEKYIKDNKKGSKLISNINNIYKNSNKEGFILDIKSSISKEIHKCQIFGDMLGTENYEESLFYPIGASIKNDNFGWCKKSSDIDFIPISKVAKLMLLFFGAGTLEKTRFIEDIAYRIYEYVYVGGNFQYTLKLNNHYRETVLSQDLFYNNISRFLKKILVDSKNIISNIRVIQLGTALDNRQKKTFLESNYIPNHVARCIVLPQTKSELIDIDKIKSNSVKNEFFKYIFNGFNPEIFIQKEAHLMVNHLHKNDNKSNIYPNQLLALTIIRNKIENFKGGLDKMPNGIQKIKNITTKLYAIKNEGERMAKIIEDENKIINLSTRLLTYIKTNNKEDFLFMINKYCNAYRSPVPLLVMDIINEESVSFADIGYAYIAGLRSNKNDKKNQETEIQKIIEN